MIHYFKYWFVIFGLFFIPNTGDAQYFGRNKPKYRDFDFKIFQTQHFSIYYYDLDSSTIQKYASWFEIWYNLHSVVLQDTFTDRNPVILYNNHADFQQTFTIGGNIDIGTGGVTEALKNRIVIPLALTNQQTFHVMGHELVHAFQYNMILRGDSTSYESLGNYPLWVIEGLAEYLSIGRQDVHTAMWMRDAVASKDFPSLLKMNKPDYFPYRFGHAFWCFFSGLYGDDKIPEFFHQIGKYGLEYACEDILKTHVDTLSNTWQRMMKQYYKDQLSEHLNHNPGKKIINDDNAGRINISPSLSPNGKYITFLSEKDVFTTDLFLADANSGKIIRKLFSSIKEGHIDNLNAIESAGTWSPDGKYFAFTGFKNGKSVLIIKEVETGNTKHEYSFKDVPFFSYPSWSPDGKKIIVSGLVKGQTDLYLFHLPSKKLEQITNDSYSEIQADWSADGNTVFFSTDKVSIEQGRANGQWTFSLASMDLNQFVKKDYPLFRGANVLNPQVNQRGHIYFICDRDGFRNLYKYVPEKDSVYQLTDSKFGISGLTPFSQAISLAQKKDKIVYSYYSNNSFQIYQGLAEKMKSMPVQKDETHLESAILPLINPNVNNVVSDQLNRLDSTQYNGITLIKPYKAKFGLSYIGASGGSGFGGNSIYGGLGVNGGVDLLFSDILGHNQLYTGLSLNGELLDVAAAFTYLNLGNRLPWGISVVHQPSRYFDFTQGFVLQEFIDNDGKKFLAVTDTTNLLRIFEDRLGLFMHYPVSVTNRFEMGVGCSYRYFRQDQIIDFYQDLSRLNYIGSDKTKQPTSSIISFGPYFIKKGVEYNANIGFVSDNSYFGMTSPLAGYRYRIGLAQYFGLYEYFETTFDFRKYFWLKPISVGVRAFHNARYGKDALIFYPTLVGDYGLMHGYGFEHLDRLRERYDIQFSQISGSKIGIASLEIRLPIVGPKRLALIPASFLPIELNVFFDGGVAWDEFSDFKSNDEIVKPLPVFSTGFGLRFNLFGALVVEPYLAWPLQSNSKVLFGFNFLPGW